MPPPTPTYNNMFALQQQSPYQQLATQMAQLQSQLNGLTMVNQGGCIPVGNSAPLGTLGLGSGGQLKADEINPKTGMPWKHYCWTCGCCPHWGKNCPRKAKGHKNNATFKNRMGGSNKNCL